MAGLGLLSFEGACKVGPRLAFENLIFCMFSFPLTDNDGSLCPDRGSDHIDQTQIKILGTLSLMGFLAQKHHTHIIAFSLIGEECALYDPSLEKEGMKPAHGFFQTPPCVFFSHDLAPCIYCSTVIILAMSTTIC